VQSLFEDLFFFACSPPAANGTVKDGQNSIENAVKVPSHPVQAVLAARIDRLSGEPRRSYAEPLGRSSAETFREKLVATRENDQGERRSETRLMGELQLGGIHLMFFIPNRPSAMVENIFKACGLFFFFLH